MYFVDPEPYREYGDGEGVLDVRAFTAESLLSSLASSMHFSSVWHSTAYVVCLGFSLGIVFSKVRSISALLVRRKEELDGGVGEVPLVTKVIVSPDPVDSFFSSSLDGLV